MKKFFALLLTLLLLTLASTALADVQVSFEKKEGSINGGFPYTLVVKAARAPAEDLVVNLTWGNEGDSCTLTIPAGQTKGTLTVETDVVEEKVKRVYRFAKGEGYTYSESAKHTFSILQLPRVQFYSAVNFGNVGKEMSVPVLCKNPGTVVKSNNVFTLRDTDGETVLATMTWGNPSARATFRFTVPMEGMLGYHAFSVYLGDYKVDVEGGYSTIVNPSDKAITELTLPEDLPLMAIGIDCGSSAGKTEKLLAVLDKYNVKVTFFMTGYFVRNYPEEAKMITEAGHEIGNHSNLHKHMKEMRPYDMKQEILIPVNRIEESLGVTPRLFRPPYGEFNSKMTSIARGEGMEMVMWSWSTEDSVSGTTHKKILRYALSEKVHQGTVILMHLDGIKSWETLDQMLSTYRDRGLKVVPISALIVASGRRLPPLPEGREALKFTDEYWDEFVKNLDLDAIMPVEEGA